MAVCGLFSVGLLQSDINYDDLLFPVLLFLSEALKHISPAEVKAFPSENNYLHLTFPPSSRKEESHSAAQRRRLVFSIQPDTSLAFSLSVCAKAIMF